MTQPLRIGVGEVTLSVTVEGDGPAVVLCHGFPQTSHCWRHQVPTLVAAGYRVVTPDLRGFGGSDTPQEVEAYRSDRLVGDLTGLLDALDLEDAVVVGHDWGAQLAWWTAALAPERVRAVVGLSVPFARRSAGPPIEILRSRADGWFFYMDYFQEPGVAEAELGARTRDFLAAMFYTVSGSGPAMKAIRKEGSVFLDQLTIPETLPPWLTDHDLDTYVAAFERSGWTAPLNWYRAMDPSWHALPELGTQKLTMPSAFLGGERDPVLMFTPRRHMQTWLTDFREETILPGIGHWIAEESLRDTTEFLLRFLESTGGVDVG